MEEESTKAEVFRLMEVIMAPWELRLLQMSSAGV